MSKRKTHEEFIKELNVINNNIIVLSKYINNHDKIMCQCNICKYKWYPTPKTLLRGSGCPKCAGKAKKTHQEFIKEIKIKHPNIDVIGMYNGNNHNILCKCKIDEHEWCPTPNSLLRGQGCPKCAGNMKKTHQEFVDEINIINPNIKIKGRYINSNTRILCQCKIHKIEWYACPGNLRNGSGCFQCGIETRASKNAMKHSDFVEKLKKIAPDILVLGKYKNNTTPIKIKCQKCNYTWEKNTYSLLHKSHGCPNCNKTLRLTKRDYEKEFYKNNTNSTIVNIEMDEEFVKMKGMLRVKCKKDDYEWDINSGYAMRHNIQCPVCRNFKTVSGVNDLATLHPELIKYFKHKKRAKIVNSGAKALEEMVCPYCGNEKKISPRQLVKNGFGCQECSDGISYPNKFCRAFLKQLPISNLIFEYNPGWIKPKRFDNYFEYNGKKYILEADGGFHFQDNTYTNESCFDAKLKDLEKEKIAAEHDISVIRIDCRKSNLSYISNSILDSTLSEIFDLSNINWNKCNEQATNSLIYEICKNYDSRNCTLDKQTDTFIELSALYGVHYETIKRYLKKGTELGLCHYDNTTYIKRISKKVILFDNKNNFIAKFLSPIQCINYLNENYPTKNYKISGVYDACKRKTHKYKEFFIKYSE